jgi:hypothetical protein
MKRATLTIAAFLIAASASAWERPLNPDRFPSIGLNVDNFHTSGEFTSVSSPNLPLTLVERGPAQDSYTGLGVDVRFPATDSVTLGAGYTHIDGDSVHSRNNNIYRESVNYTGYRLTFSARLYLN